ERLEGGDGGEAITRVVTEGEEEEEVEEEEVEERAIRH
ncbi:unnamed protein product, partial [Musa textilis]